MEQNKHSQAFLDTAAKYSCPKCKAAYVSIEVHQDYVVRDFNIIEITEDGEAQLSWLDRDDNGHVQAAWCVCQRCNYSWDIDKDELL